MFSFREQNEERRLFASAGNHGNLLPDRYDGARENADGKAKREKREERREDNKNQRPAQSQYDDALKSLFSFNL